MRNLKLEEIIEETKNKRLFKGKTSQEVFIKEYKYIDEPSKKKVQKQISLHYCLQHKNIVKILDTYQNKRNLFLVFQYFERNFNTLNKENLENHLIAKYIYELLQGIQFIHALGYVHRNLKPENILIVNEGHVKICGLGNLCSVNNANTENITKRWYRAPEVLVGYSYNKAVDIWALGCIIGELIISQPLFPGTNEIDQLSKIYCLLGELPSILRMQLEKNFILKKAKKMNPTVNVFEKIEKKVGKSGVDLLKKMLELNPLERITASEAKKHEYFQILKDLSNENLKKVSNWITEIQPPKILQKWQKNIKLSMTSRLNISNNTSLMNKQDLQYKCSSQEMRKKCFQNANLKHFFSSTNTFKKYSSIKPMTKASLNFLKERDKKSSSNSKENQYSLLFYRLAIKNKKGRTPRTLQSMI